MLWQDFRKNFGIPALRTASGTDAWILRIEPKGEWRRAGYGKLGAEDRACFVFRFARRDHHQIPCPAAERGTADMQAGDFDFSQSFAAFRIEAGDLLPAPEVVALMGFSMRSV